MGLDISLIITCWNSQPYLDECLESLRQIRYDGEVVIVEERRGWSAAVNKGVRESKNQILIVSNPDIVFNKTLYLLIEKFRREMVHQTNPYLVITPALEHPNTRLQKYKKIPELIDLFITQTTIGRWIDAAIGKPIWNGREQLSRTGNLDPSELPTASLFITTKKLLERYPLDETMWRAEDWDLWRRLARDKIRTVWTEEARFIHHIGHSAKNRTAVVQRRIELQGVNRYVDKWNIHPRLFRIMVGVDRIFSIPLRALTTEK